MIMKQTLTALAILSILLALPLQAADDLKSDGSKQDFTMTQVASPPITLSLAKAMPTHVAFDLVPDIQYKVSGTNRYENLLIGTECEAQPKSGDSKVMRITCFIPTGVTNASGVLWTAAWREFTGFIIQDSVRGKGTVRIALFEAIASGSGDKADFKYGHQVSNALEMPVKATQY
jgi:hypothetical protein